jgi:hypothetical protein
MNSKIANLGATFQAASTDKNESKQHDWVSLLVTLMEKISEQKMSFDGQLAEARAKTEETLSSLREEMRREMAEQTLVYENQRAKDRAKAEQAFAVQECKIEKMRKDFEKLQATITSNIHEIVKKENHEMRRDFAASQVTVMATITELDVRTDRILGRQRTEMQKMRADFSALQKKLPSEKMEFCRMDGVLTGYMDPEILRRIHKAFAAFPYYEETQEKVKRIYRQVKKDFTDRPVKCKQTQALVDRAMKSQRFQNKPGHHFILYCSVDVIKREQCSKNPMPSIDYINLLMATFECI